MSNLPDQLSYQRLLKGYLPQVNFCWKSRNIKLGDLPGKARRKYLLTQSAQILLKAHWIKAKSWILKLLQRTYYLKIQMQSKMFLKNDGNNTAYLDLDLTHGLKLFQFFKSTERRKLHYVSFNNQKVSFGTPCESPFNSGQGQSVVRNICLNCITFIQSPVRQDNCC